MNALFAAAEQCANSGGIRLARGARLHRPGHRWCLHGLGGVPVSTPSIAKRVARGAEWLDANVPGWFDWIDLERLDMAVHQHGIRGQIPEAQQVCWYYDAPRMGLITYSDACGGSGYTEEHRELTAEWVRVITERRTAAGETS